jgi:crotonobetainyl-CoA:carnitine CoA-transferase CaiB-like acyl-CoA transferase
VRVRDPQGQPVDLVGNPFHIAGARLPNVAAPPRLGQHTDEVLTQLTGLSPSELANLRKSGIIE